MGPGCLGPVESSACSVYATLTRPGTTPAGFVAMECSSARGRPASSTFYDCYGDLNADGLLDDSEGSGVAGDAPCTGGNTLNCDDNCVAIWNSDETDSDADGVGDACDSRSYAPTSVMQMASR